jgi:predicted unusual protein kinase regulating ubiquinone biosynthesis (AarF/ABC1/UbiB family)
MADDERDEIGGFRRSGRLERFMKMGGLAVGVAGKAALRRVGAAFKSEEEKAAATREALLESAGKVVKTMGQMKGAAMKLGQMLSVAPEALPREFLEELRGLQKDSPPMSYELVSEQIERSLHRPLRSVFSYFDATPLGAASIGQVHRARTFDGREVAVKVQYPGIADTLEADLANLASMLNVARVVADRERVEAVIAEVKRGIIEEADYTLEAANLKKFGPILERHPRIVTPRVVDELSSKEVLTMTFLEGTKLDVAIDRLEDRAARDQLAYDFSETIVWMFHREFVLHADPHPGNYLVLPDGRFAFLDFGCFREYDAAFCDGWLDVLVAKWRHEKQRLPDIHERLGFGDGQGGRLTADQLHELTEITLQPFLYDREFDWATWRPQDGLEQFVKNNLGIFRYTAPPRAAFYVRVCGGIWGFLQRSKTRGNWYRMARSTAEARGLI